MGDGSGDPAGAKAPDDETIGSDAAAPAEPGAAEPEGAEPEVAESEDAGPDAEPADAGPEDAGPDAEPDADASADDAETGTAAPEDAAPAEAASPDAAAELDETLWRRIADATVLRSRPQLGERVLSDGLAAALEPTIGLVGPAGVVDAEATADGYDLVQSVLGLADAAQSGEDVEAEAERLVALTRPGGRLAVVAWARGALDPLPELAFGALAPVQNGEFPVTETAEASPVVEGADTAGSLAHALGELGLAEVRSTALPRRLLLDDETGGALAWELARGAGILGAFAVDDDDLEAARERFETTLHDRSVRSLDVTVLIATGRRPA